LTFWLLHARAWFSDAGMEMTSRAQKRVLWQQRLADLEASGMPQAAYCAAQGIGCSTLQRWQRLLRRDAAALPCVEHDRCDAAASGLIPIRVAAAVTGSALAVALPGLTLTWPNGLHLRQTRRRLRLTAQPPAPVRQRVPVEIVLQAVRRLGQAALTPPLHMHRPPLSRLARRHRCISS